MNEDRGDRTQAGGPLRGIRVVDLTAMVMGPYATQIMADMGAEVIKVEPPEGDGTRYISVAPTPAMSGVFANVNRGKRSVVLDLQRAFGKEALRKLIATADVFIHSMRGKAIAKLGFAYADVAAVKPDIVYTNCYGYGRRGPEADQPAYDDTIQAECGLTAVQEMLTGQASFVGTIMADKVGYTSFVSTTELDYDKRSAVEMEVPMSKQTSSVEDDPAATGLSLSAYPNPTSGNVSVSFSAVAGSGELSIINTVGETMLAMPLNVVDGLNAVTLDASTLAEGLYFVRLNGGRLNETGAFVVMR